MFGYVRTDTPYLYIKDDRLYRAMYCGVCKGIAEVCGQSARMGLSYDVTFFSVLLHNRCIVGKSRIKRLLIGSLQKLGMEDLRGLGAV